MYDQLYSILKLFNLSVNTCWSHFGQANNTKFIDEIQVRFRHAFFFGCKAPWVDRLNRFESLIRLMILRYRCQKARRYMVMIQSNRWSNCFSEIVTCIQQNRSFVSQIYYTQQNIDEGLTLEMLIFETLHGGQFTISWLSWCNQIILWNVPLTQQRSFFRKVSSFLKTSSIIFYSLLALVLRLKTIGIFPLLRENRNADSIENTF